MTTEALPASLEKILDRVKKMMALANCQGATEGERDTALSMAYKLLAKHNLSMVDVNATEDIPKEERDSLKATFVVYPWARQISGFVAGLFFCNYYFIRAENGGKQASHVFIGKESNVTTAQYMAEFVVKSVLREGAKLYGSATSPEARNFAIGVVAKLGERIRQLKKDAENDNKPKGNMSTAIVLASLYDSERAANKAWLDAAGVRLRSKTSYTKGMSDTNAYNAGKDFGSRVSLAPQIGTVAPRYKQIA